MPAGAHVHVLELDTPHGCSAFEIVGDVGSVVVLTDTESRAITLRDEARRRRVEVHAVAAPLLSLPFAAASFDVIVAHDALAHVTGPDTSTARASFVRRLIALLEPGGALWIDHDRRSALENDVVSLPEAKRAIVNGGAIPAETFERFGRTGRELLPLDEETVSAWRDPERESRPHSRWTRWLPRARRTPDRFGILVTTARTSGAGPGRLSILARTSRAVRESWPMLALEGTLPGRLRYWLDSRDPSPSGTLNAMPFREGESRPLALVKIARDGGAAMRLRNEHGLLRQLADESPRSADVLFPRSLLVVDSES
ncbi:MAG: class I SAM-dependent methyltransferase, partial [Gemmatimonadetes bacterium]|nr:class I SAM-dependent methyltransferase [Gemmatimonadota bacterium]